MSALTIPHCPRGSSQCSRGRKEGKKWKHIKGGQVEKEEIKLFILRQHDSVCRKS